MRNKIKMLRGLFFVAITFFAGMATAGEDALSPQISIQESTVQESMSAGNLLTETSSLASEPVASAEINFGSRRWQIRMNKTNFVIRQNLKYSRISGNVVEVQNSLFQILPDNKEQFAGQSWFRVENEEAILEADASGDNLRPAFSIEDRGNGYGTVLFASMLESAREQNIKIFTVIYPVTSIYRRFGFKEFDDMDQAYKVIKPNDPSYFSIATDLAQERGISVETAEISSRENITPRRVPVVGPRNRILNFYGESSV